jgi:acetyl-CoA carboxylase biotin carboxylase subunit
MIKKLLVANRGEIALRIIRACKEMGVKSVAVYSEADKESLPVLAADESVCIGPASPRDSYLNIDNIISAALTTGADAIHPGFGFLSENANFARIVQKHGLVFIGPSPEAIEKMGDKAVARETVVKAGVPVVPGSPGPVDNEETAFRIAGDIGYPVMVKASAGGGGRGMRVANSPEELVSALQTASAESLAAFGNAEVYLEKFVVHPRHIEFQILGDQYGNLIHLGERDCSIQRRNQKVIEEAPSTALNDKLRSEMGQAAVKAASAVHYCGAGTIEFLLDDDGRYYFIEMNTRIQVEHPITEMITGIDLIKEQILVASGEKLALTQADVDIRGWALECRINAEDPGNDFMPCPGTITKYVPPGGPGIRVDSAAYQGWKIPHHYDSMLGKLITWGQDREEAVARMARALDEFIIEGVKTTIPFHKLVLKNKHFIRGDIDTGFIEKHIFK